ncbi:YceI family protein [Nafulsella turpanensis]|uniref:YceI family protein n=1 Tax=Nafulsella turpanensis TaxID=1265690 RepID=UPI00135F13B0|nr:YceI family protein [Nafulsella turpanensis]
MERKELKAEKVVVAGPQPVNSIIRYSPVKINTKESVIHWRATKMMGTAGHKGTVKFQGGTLFFENDTLMGGTVIADMSTISISNSGEYGQTTLKNLSNYLKKKSFSAEEFPTASFHITEVKYLGGDSLRVWGNMQIKDVRKHISVPAILERSGEKTTGFLTHFRLGRKMWNIGKGGNLLEENLVDEDFQLSITLAL